MPNSPVGRTFQVTGLHLGPTGSVLTFNEAALPYGGQLGQVFERAGKFFRLVQIDTSSGVNYIDGGVAFWKSKATYQITADSTASEGLSNTVAGGTNKAITVTAASNPYVFIQVGGDQAAVVVAASTVAGDLLTGGANNVLTRTAMATAPVNKLVAIALSTRGTTTSDNGASVSNSSKVRWEAGALCF